MSPLRKGVKTPNLGVCSTTPTLKDGVIVLLYHIDINTLTPCFSLGVNILKKPGFSPIKPFRSGLLYKYPAIDRLNGLVIFFLVSPRLKLWVLSIFNHFNGLLKDSIIYKSGFNFIIID